MAAIAREARLALKFHVYDVFTDKPFAGNPLAIVEAADHLSTRQMQTIARQFNLSETIFVRTPEDPKHTASVRIFFPIAEIPFAGHPTIGCAIHLASQKFGDGDFETRITLEEVAGLVPVDVKRFGGVVTAEFVAPILPHPHAGQVVSDLVPAALGLSRGDIGFGGHTSAIWAGGPVFLYIPIASATALSRARPLEPQWSQLLDAAQVDSAYLYTPNGSGGYSARMFSPTAGIPEDPATGSASAILAGQLLNSGDLTEGTSRIALRQGADMGRPSDIFLTAVVKDKVLTEVRIAGSSCAISNGSLTAIPPED